MIDPASQELNFVGTMSDAFDGTARLLCDIQRFGFRLSSLCVLTERQGVEFAVTVSVPKDSDPGQILSRFSRHVAMLSLRLDGSALQ